MHSDRNILIVDDSPVIRQLITGTLLKAGYKHVDQAARGKEALLALAEKTYNLVLLDYNMPEMNGAEVLKKIKAQYPDVIVIMLSDQADKNLVVSLMREADDYIVKEDIDKIKDELLHVFTHCLSFQDLILTNRELMETLSTRNKKLEVELKMARNLQLEIFPHTIEKSPVFLIDAVTSPCETIGGDFFYTIRHDPSHLGIFMGDICGHGLQAALLSFTFANALKTTLEQPTRLSAAETVRRLNTLLVKHFPTGNFATGSYLVLDETNSTIAFSGAFETPVLHYKTNGDINEMVNGNIVFLGLVDNNLIKFEESVVTMQKGEKLFIFTDGLVEVKDSERNFFQLTGVKSVIRKYAHEPVNVICNKLYEAALTFSNNKLFDDITVIGIEKK